MSKSKYKRILLKLSGEALQGDQGHGISPAMLAEVAGQIKEIHSLGVEIALVIGGGNIFRGISGSAQGMERSSADYMGMLATVINALAMQSALEAIDLPTHVQTATTMSPIAEPFDRRKAVDYLGRGEIVIFAGGTGSPYFTTDTAAALRASEIDADVIMKATKVDGVYDSDPVKNPDAIKYESITHLDVLRRELKVMDATAIALCNDNHLPILVFNLTQEGNIQRAVLGESVGTLVVS